MNKPRINRRTALKGLGGVTIGLPLLEEMLCSAPAAAPAPRERSWYAEAALGLLDLTPAGLVLIFCFVPSISASIFRSWSCQAPSHS